MISPEDLEQWMKNREETRKRNATGMPLASQKNIAPVHSGVSPNSELAYAAAYEVKKAEADMLKERVAQLEKEVTEARQEAREAWQSFNNLSSKVVDIIASQPLLLSAQFRVK